MSDDLATLQISIKASMADFSTKMGEFEKILKGSEEQTKKTGAGFGEMAAGMLTAEAAMAALKKTADLALDSIKGFDDDLMRTLRLSKSLGEEGSAGIQAYNKAISEKTRFAKDDLDAAAVQLDIHKLNREEMEKLMPVIVDFATKSGRDAASTADAFGRAIEFGTTRGLRPFGIDVDKAGSQLDILNAIIEAGTIPGIKGIGEEAGKLGMGPLLIMRHEIEELQDDLGEDLLPIFQELMSVMRDVGMPALKGVSDNISTIIPLVEGFGVSLATYFAVTKIAAMATAINGMTISVAALNVALAANPIALAAIAAGLATIGIKWSLDLEKKSRTNVGKYDEATGEVKNKSGEVIYRKNAEGGFSPVSQAEKEAQALARMDLSAYGKQQTGIMGGSTTGAAFPLPDVANYGAFNFMENQPAQSGLSAVDRGKDKKTGAKVKSAYSEKGSDATGPYTVYLKEQKLKEQNDKKALETQKSLDKSRLDAKKKAADSELALLKHVDAENDATLKRIEARNKATVDSYIAVGQSFGQEIANAILNGQEPLKESLRGMLKIFVDFLEQFTVAAIAKNTVKLFGEMGPVGLLIGALEAAGATAVFEIAKAKIMKFHDGGEVPAILQAGEYVMNRRAVAQYGVPAMEAINHGRAPAGGGAGGGATTIINTIDPGMLDRYLSSSAGQKTIVNVMKAKRYEVNRVLK